MQMTPLESKLNLLLEILALWHILLQRIHISQPQEVTLQYEKQTKTNTTTTKPRTKVQTKAAATRW